MPFLNADGLSLVDIVMLAVILIGLPLESFLSLKKSRAELASGAPGVRIKHYTSTITLLWAIALPIIVLWATSGRGWDALGFQVESGWIAVSGWALAGLVAALFVYQFASVSNSNETR